MTLDILNHTMSITKITYSRPPKYQTTPTYLISTPGRESGKYISLNLQTCSIERCMKSDDHKQTAAISIEIVNSLVLPRLPYPHSRKLPYLTTVMT